MALYHWENGPKWAESRKVETFGRLRIQNRQIVNTIIGERFKTGWTDAWGGYHILDKLLYEIYKSYRTPPQAPVLTRPNICLILCSISRYYDIVL